MSQRDILSQNRNNKTKNKKIVLNKTCMHQNLKIHQNLKKDDFYESFYKDFYERFFLVNIKKVDRKNKIQQDF